MRKLIVVLGLAATALHVACSSSSGSRPDALAGDGPSDSGAAGSPDLPDGAGLSDAAGLEATGGAGGQGGTMVDAGSAGGSDGRTPDAGPIGIDAPSSNGGATDGAGGAGGSDAASPLGDSNRTDGPTATGTSDALDVPMATGDAGLATDTASPVPAILSFRASPTAVSGGMASTLAWQVTGATTLTIEPGIGSVLGKTSQVVTPSQTTTYTLTLNGSLSAQATVTVSAAPLPFINSFVVNPTTVMEGGSAILTAVFSGGTASVDHGIGGVTSGMGRDTGELTADTTYTLTVTNSSGVPTTAQVTVKVKAMQGIFTAVADMTEAKAGHTATIATSGKVLMLGSSCAIEDPVYNQLFDPRALVFAKNGYLQTTRRAHSATLLPDGINVLVVGGIRASTLMNAEICRADTEISCYVAASMSGKRNSHTATLLPDNTVLITGGATDGGWDPPYLSSTEVYDPLTSKFAAGKDMTTSRSQHTATLLANGQVLIVGGANSGLETAELYDPATKTFTATGSMASGRYGHTATRLRNGKVLIVGGGGSSKTPFAELYDPATGSFTTTGPVVVQRNHHAATLLSNGKVLITGGIQSTPSLASAEIYDPASDAFTATGDMTVARRDHTATLLQDGTVLVAGGSNTACLSSAEIFQ